MDGKIGSDVEDVFILEDRGWRIQAAGICTGSMIVNLAALNTTSRGTNSRMYDVEFLREYMTFVLAFKRLQAGVRVPPKVLVYSGLVS